MDRKLSANRIAVAALAAFALLALCVADLGALAQNANSSTTADPSMENHNMAGHAPARRRRGRRRPRPAAAATDASMAADASAGQERTDGGEQTDLSGTYTGRLTMRGGHDMAGEATLTITGNSFTLAGEGMNHTGRVLAVTTRGYIGAAFFFSDLTDADTKTPVVASVRVRRYGNRLSVDPVPGTRTRMTFRGGSS